MGFPIVVLIALTLTSLAWPRLGLAISGVMVALGSTLFAVSVVTELAHGGRNGLVTTVLAVFLGVAGLIPLAVAIARVARLGNARPTSTNLPRAVVAKR